MIWPWQRSIQLRIVLILSGILGCALLLLNALMIGVVTRSQLEETANHLQIQALLAAQSLELDDHEHDREGRLPAWIADYAARSQARLTVTDRDGTVLTGDAEPLLADELAAAAQGRPLQRWTSSQIYASAPIRHEEHLVGVVRLAIPRARADTRSRQVILRLAGSSAGALLAALLAAAWLSRRLVAPLKSLESSALRAAKGEWDEPVDLPGHDELASLSRAFTTMLAELKAMLERQRRFIANASHELRTPLTRLKLRTEALAGGGWQDAEVAEKFTRELDQEVDGLTRLANSLLDLARLEERPDQSVTADAGALMQELAESWRETLVHAGLLFRAEVDGKLPPLRLSAENLRSLVENLLENAWKATPSGGEIALLAERTDAGARLIVEDTGSGIPAHHLPHIFDRFYRVPSGRDRKGTGLGLALVKAAAESAGGRVLVSSTVGQGTRFTVELPGC